jgi:twitching motility protein PilT
MSSSNESLLGRVAVAANLITPEQLEEALRVHGRSTDGSLRLGQILVNLGFFSEDQLGQLIELQKQVVAKAREKAQRRARSEVAAPSDGYETSFLGAEPVLGDPELEQPTPAEPDAFEPDAFEPSALEQAESEPAVAEPAVAKPAVAKPAPAERPAPKRARARLPKPAPAAPTDATAHDRSWPDSLDGFLMEAARAGASDVHIHSAAPLKMRLLGRLHDHGSLPLPPAKAEELVMSSLDPEQRASFEEFGEVDFCYELEGVGRFRANAYRQLRGVDAAYRFIPLEPPSLDSLSLPSSLARFTSYHQGMVLLTGPTSCGKSSTLAALVNLINEDRAEHILTIEDPIEFLHESKRCVVNQRSVRRDTQSFARALRGALREDPDVIVIGELRDRETIALAMSAAETGHLVLATLHTDNAIRTVNRIVGAFPPSQQDQVRTMLSESLKAVISQRMVPGADGVSLLPALEVMVVNRAIGNMIREQKTVQIHSMLQTGSGEGMCLLDNSLAELVRSGRVAREDALRACEDPKLIP